MVEFAPPPPLTEEGLLALLERNFEDHWISGLLEDPSSRSLFIGWIAALLRVQGAIDENLSRGTFILTAPGRASATSVVRLERPSGGLVTIPTNLRFLDNRGAFWVPTADFEIPASGGAQVVDVPIRTERFGYYLNSFEPLTYQAYDALPDPNLVVTLGPDPAVGGTSPFLDQHGKERKTSRADNESDTDYRHRLLFLVDQVSPRALADATLQILDSFPVTKDTATLIARYGFRPVIEPFRDSAQPAQRGLMGSDIFFADVDFADDPHGPLLRDTSDALAWFDVVLPFFTDPDEARFFADDGFADDPDFGFLDLGPSTALTTPIAVLADELDRRRAAGVGFRIIQGVPLTLARHPALDDLVQAGDWVDQNGSNDNDELANALADHDGDFRYAVSATGQGPGVPATAGDLVFDLEDIPDPAFVSHVVLRAWVKQRDIAAGTDPDFGFVIRPATSVLPIRVTTNDYPRTIDHETWREYVAILEQNPATSAPWTMADVSGAFGVGVANMATGATEELWVSELVLEIVANY